MRVTIVIASVLIAVAFMYLGARWIVEYYVPRPITEQPTGPFHNSGSRRTAESAVRRFSRLSAHEQAAVRKNLEQNIVSVERWFDRVRGPGVKLLCLGEDHEDATRHFLARRLFSALEIDVVFLEVTPHQLGRISQELRWGREQVSLLGADIAGIMRAARSRNPEVEFIGIEETKSQRIARQKRNFRRSRDESIQNNFWRDFRYGQRHAILFGALHCMNRDQWLYGGIRRLAPRRVANEMINVRVFEQHQDGSIEALAYFLAEIGVHRNDFVVLDSKAVHPLIREWFDLLAVILEDFTALMVFRNHP